MADVSMDDFKAVKHSHPGFDVLHDGKPYHLNVLPHSLMLTITGTSSVVAVYPYKQIESWNWSAGSHQLRILFNYAEGPHGIPILDWVEFRCTSSAKSEDDALHELGKLMKHYHPTTEHAVKPEHPPFKPKRRASGSSHNDETSAYGGGDFSPASHDSTTPSSHGHHGGGSSHAKTTNGEYTLLDDPIDSE